MKKIAFAVALLAATPALAFSDLEELQILQLQQMQQLNRQLAPPVRKCWTEEYLLTNSGSAGYSERTVCAWVKD